MPYDLYCKAKVKNRVCKQCGIYYPSIAARQLRRQDGCGLEVSSDKLINKVEDISHEGGKNFEILVADVDGDHAPIINIYELLMNSEPIEIQTGRQLNHLFTVAI